MKVLITGGAGFIGSHLSEYFLKEGHFVSAIDNLSTGCIQNVAHLHNKPNYQLVIDSILNENTLEPLIRDSHIVYHLAAAVGVKLIVKDPVNTIETNIRGTELILHYANKWRKPVLFTSTSEVYGKNTNASFQESDDMVFGATTHSRWSYACSKAIDEFLTIAYHRKKSLPVIVVRLFNTVGPRQTSQYGMVLPTFVQQALNNKDITVFGDGSQRRTFTYVTDVVYALSKLPNHSSSFGEVFNIGGDQEISIYDLAVLVKEHTGSLSNIVLVPYDQAYEPGFEDMARRVPNISKITQTIGYHPTVGLEEMVDRVVENTREKIKKGLTPISHDLHSVL